MGSKLAKIVSKDELEFCQALEKLINEYMDKDLCWVCIMSALDRNCMAFASFLVHQLELESKEELVELIDRHHEETASTQKQEVLH